MCKEEKVRERPLKGRRRVEEGVRPVRFLRRIRPKKVQYIPQENQARVRGGCYLGPCEETEEKGSLKTLGL